MSKRASITDVARRAGVSISTVSLVMNNRPNVAPDTAKAVRDAARELAYQPGGGPGKKRGPKPGPRRNLLSRQIGVVLGGYPDAVLRDGICTALVHGIANICGTEGFQAVPVIAPDPEEVRTLIRHAKFDGLMLIGHPHSDRLADLLCRVPTVQLLGLPPDESGWDHVGFDGLEVARRVCQTLAEEGCKTCWYLGMRRFVYHQLAECIEVECRQFGLEFRTVARSDYFAIGPSGPVFDCAALGHDLASLLADPGPGPAGVFAENAALAMAFDIRLRERQETGEAPVRAIISDATPCCLHAEARFRSFVDLHVADMARQGVDQLLWRVNHRNEPRVRRIVSVSLWPPT